MAARAATLSVYNSDCTVASFALHLWTRGLDRSGLGTETTLEMFNVLHFESQG